MQFKKCPSIFYVTVSGYQVRLFWPIDRQLRPAQQLHLYSAAKVSYRALMNTSALGVRCRTR